MLADHCGNCGKPLGWLGTKGIDHCEHCGASLTRVAAAQIDADLVPEAAEVAALVSPSADLRGRAAKRLPAPFCDWEPGHIFAAIVNLGPIGANPEQRGRASAAIAMARGDFRQCDVNQLCTGYSLVTEWPESLIDLLDAVTAPVRNEGGDWQDTLGQLGRFFHHHAPDTPIGRLLRSEIPHALRKLPIPFPVVRNSTLLGIPRQDTIGLAEARREFRIDNRVVARLKGRAEGALTSPASRHRTHLFDRARLAKSVCIYREAVGLKAIAKGLGIPPYCVNSLAACGLPIFDGQSARSLFATLDAISPAPEGGIPLAVALQWRLHSEQWAGAFKAVVNGQVRVLGVNRHVQARSDRLLVDAAELGRLVNALPRKQEVPEATLTASMTARLLGMQLGFVMQAVRHGVLPAARIKSNLLAIPLSGVATFVREYVTTSEIKFRLSGVAGSFRRYDRIGVSAERVLCKSPIWRRDKLAVLFPALEQAPG